MSLELPISRKKTPKHQQRLLVLSSFFEKKPVARLWRLNMFLAGNKKITVIFFSYKLLRDWVGEKWRNSLGPFSTADHPIQTSWI